MSGECPRVLSFEEAKKLTRGTDVWIQYKHDHMIYASTFACFGQKGVRYLFRFVGNEGGLWASAYGRAYRFWTGRPTDEKATKTLWKRMDRGSERYA